MTAEKKREKIAVSVLLLLAAAVLVIGLFFYAREVVPRGYVWLYPWMGAAAAGAAVLFVTTEIVLWLPVKRIFQIWILALCVLGCVFASVLSLKSSEETVTVRKSPDRKHTLVLAENTGDGTVRVNRAYYGILRREKEQFPFTVEGSMKYQWLEKDVCAVTYKSPDGGLHQYLATFGERGNGISYTDPLVAAMGHWSIPDVNHGGWNLTIEGGEVRLKNGAEEWNFQDADAVRFGTTAIALCNNGVPQWSLVLNQDCRINYDCLIARGGTLTLCPVSMEKTAPLTFVSTDAKPEYADTDPNLPSQEEIEAADEAAWKDTLARMRGYASGEKTLEGGTEGQLGIYYVPSASEDEAWNVLLALKARQEMYRMNGVDETVQMDSVQRLAGDENDALYEVVYTCLNISPGNQGSAPEGEKEQLTWRLRMMKAASGEGYYAYLCSWREPGIEGLSGEPGEKRLLSDDPDYHYFLAGEYDTTYMYVSRRTPEEGMDILYAQKLAGEYPKAERGTYDGMPYMDLDGKGMTLLLYDGIGEDYGTYCYRRVRLEDPGPKMESRTYMEEIYTVPMREE